MQITSWGCKSASLTTFSGFAGVGFAPWIEVPWLSILLDYTGVLSHLPRISPQERILAASPGRFTTAYMDGPTIFAIQFECPVGKQDCLPCLHMLMAWTRIGKKDAFSQMNHFGGRRTMEDYLAVQIRPEGGM